MEKESGRPLVSCLCLTTANRREFLKRAIECYGRQTYSNREFVIVADGPDNIYGTGFPFNSSIIYSFGNIGRKRNLGCLMAKGEYIAVWDDDDYSAPKRLEVYINAAERRQADVIGSGVMPFTDGKDWWQFTLAPPLVFGTSLIFRRTWWEDHRFEDLQVGEDMRFAQTAADHGRLWITYYPMQYASIHPGNTSTKRVNLDPGWKKLENYVWTD